MIRARKKKINVNPCTQILHITSRTAVVLPEEGFESPLHQVLDGKQVIPNPVHVRTEGRVGDGDKELDLAPEREAGRADRQLDDQVERPVQLEQRHGGQQIGRAHV